MKLSHKTKCFAAPSAAVVASENEYYTRPTGTDKMRLRFVEVADDIYEGGERAFSSDNGRTWHDSRAYLMVEPTANGPLRRLETTGFVDPQNGMLLHLVTEGVLPSDDCWEGMSAYYLKYRVWDDGGRSTLLEENIVQRGYTPQHPIAPVHVGKNCLMTGAENSIIKLPNGELLVAAMITPLGPDGEYSNPAGALSFHEVVLLRGQWQSDGRIGWELAAQVAISHELSTRGLSEPTLALLPDGRVLMVMRGSNQNRSGKLPGRKWVSISDDNGHNWSTPQPWTYDDGAPISSPSSICQLLQHSSGKYFWIGNICDNPQSNGPRYPLYIGEVDTQTTLLKRDTLLEIDTLQEGEHPSLSLSNFSAHEERESGDILLHMTRHFSDDGFSGDAYLYRIKVDTVQFNEM